MERFKLRELNEWYASKMRKPLIVWGARQVGKTYLIKNLFAGQFKDYIYIDLKKDSEACRYFSSTQNPDDHISYIELRYSKKPSSDIPLIFDEVQQCPAVISALKYYCQDHRDIPVIATGSMVRLSLKHEADGDFLFPVGKVDSMNLFPLSFGEYMFNVNSVLYNRVCEAYRSRKPMEQYEHESALDLLHEYLIIGGMPEADQIFIDTHSFEDANRALHSIYDSYLLDMDVYSKSEQSVLRTRNVYANIFAQLNKENRNFKVGDLERGRSNRDFFNAYQWLELSRIVYRSSLKDGKVSVPMNSESSSLFRLYLSDPGLFTVQSKVPRTDFFVRDNRNVLSGIFYESYVADELVSKGHDLFYWIGKNRHEFEFLIQCGSRIIPVDVKRTGGKMNSLDAYRSFNGSCTAVKISANNFGYDRDRDILTIPLYEAFLFAEEMAREDALSDIIGGV